MVDYSKWDKLEVSDSDDDSGPTVTKLDAASSITIPARGSAAAAGKKPEISIRPSPEPTADDAGEGMSAEEYYRSFEGGTGDGPDAASGSTPVVASVS